MATARFGSYRAPARLSASLPAYSTWLDPHMQSPTLLRELMVPAPDDLLTAVPVSTHVNTPDNDDAACVAPLSETR